jgi:VanZ family protein
MQPVILPKSADNRNPRIFLNLFVKKHLPYILWGLVIFVLISIPGDDLPEFSDSFDLFQPDKWAHVALFLGFTFLVLRGFYQPAMGDSNILDITFYGMLAGVLYSGGSEIFQYLIIPGRSATLKDFLFNVVGCLFGWIVFLIWKDRIQKRLPKHQ